jgi:hypothetical protein
MILFISPDNPALGEIIGRHLQSHLVTRKDPDEVLSQLTADMRKYYNTILEFDSEQSIG